MSAVQDELRDLDEADGAPRQRVPQLGRGDHVELAQLTLDRIEGEGAPSVHDEGDLRVYAPDRGLWTVVDEAEQSRIVQSFAGSSIHAQNVPLKIRASVVAGSMKLASHQRARPNFFADAPKGLTFRNGFVRVTKDGVLAIPHAPEHRARYGYAFDYEPCAYPKKWLAFLSSLFRDDDDDRERVGFVQEFFGACMVAIAPTYQKCLVAVGAGENGKSKLGDIMHAAMPYGSVTSVPPQLFANEQRRAVLAGKLLNFVAELPEAEILDSEAFKAIVDGSQIQGKAVYKPPFDFRPVAGHYYAANRLPGSNDTTHAFWRRFVILNFTRTFREGDPDRDPHVATKLIALELPAIVSWLLEGASRVIRQGGYAVPPSHESALAAWKLSADQVALFVSERMLPSSYARPEGDHDWTTAAQVYESYRRWADAAGHRPPLARNKFGGRLAAIGTPKLVTEQGTLYGIRTRQPGE